MTPSSNVLFRIGFTGHDVPAWAGRLPAPVRPQIVVDSATPSGQQVVLISAQSSWGERASWLAEATRTIFSGGVVLLYGPLPQSSFDVGALAHGLSTVEGRGSTVIGLSTGFAAGVEFQLYHSQTLQEWPGTCVLATPSGGCIMTSVRQPLGHGLLLITTLELGRRTMLNRHADIASMLELIAQQVRPSDSSPTVDMNAPAQPRDEELNSYLLAVYSLLMRGVAMTQPNVQEECLRLFGVQLPTAFWPHWAAQHSDPATVRLELEERGLWMLYGRRLFPYD